MDDPSLLLAVPDVSGQKDAGISQAWISVATAAHMLLKAGLARNKRTIRRYCERGDLDCRKTENALHQPQYFIDAASVETYITQQRTLLASQPDASGLAQTEPDEASDGNPDGDFSHGPIAGAGQPGHDRINPDTTGPRRAGSSGEVLTQLEARIADKDAEIEFLRSELLHRRTTDSALHDVIAAFRANAEAQRLAAAPAREEQGTTREQPMAS